MWEDRMQFITYIILFGITAYTFGFGVTLWKEKQKLSAAAVFFLCLAIIVLPFFTII
jgi:4-amino-4-deoxy-L-arabinose transferase-like glycosyltransferase